MVPVNPSISASGTGFPARDDRDWRFAGSLKDATDPIDAYRAAIDECAISCGALAREGESRGIVRRRYADHRADCARPRKLQHIVGH